MKTAPFPDNYNRNTVQQKQNRTIKSTLIFEQFENKTNETVIKDYFLIFDL